MNWKELIILAREMAETPPSHRLQQTWLRLAVSTVYYALYHSLARSNADLLVKPPDTEGGAPPWNRVYAALGGDAAHELMRADFSEHPEAIRRFADAFLAAHQQRLLAEEDPVFTLTADQAHDWVDRVEAAIVEFLSVEPQQRRVFALHILLRSPGMDEPTD